MVKVGLKLIDTHQMVDVDALLDSSATGVFMDEKFAEHNGIAMWKLNKPIHVYNVDGTLNQGGFITHETSMMLSHKEHCKKAVFEACDLRKSNIIIDYTWLKKHNLGIKWKTGDVQFTRCFWECSCNQRT